MVIYVKGADSTVLNALAPVRAGSAEATELDRTRAIIDEYSRAGLRTLVMARRVMSPALWEEWLHSHNRVSEATDGEFYIIIIVLGF